MGPPVLLCIDDRVELLRIRKTTFEQLGCSVITATTLPAAIALLERTAVAAVLLEYKSEGMDAETIACQIKRRFPAQPVILLSAYSDVPERVFWLVDEYVMQSDPPERVLQLVEDIRSRTPKAAGIPAKRHVHVWQR
jgi:CheY-like chemotaxis protein